MQGSLLALLIALAIYFAQRNRDELTALTIAAAVLLAVIGFALPLVLNHVFDTDFLHRFHKLIAFVAAPALFTSWIAWVRYRARRHRSIRRARRI